MYDRIFLHSFVPVTRSSSGVRHCTRIGSGRRLLVEVSFSTLAFRGMLHHTICSMVGAKAYREGAMIINLVFSGLAILFAWTVFDVVMHRLALRPLYERDPGLWRSFDHLNVVLIYVATF